MTYQKVVIAGQQFEIFKYEGYPRNVGKRRGTVSDSSGVDDISESRKDAGKPVQSTPERKDQNIRRAALSFRRLVLSNLRGPDNPVLVTLTYKEVLSDIDTARKDFNAFAKALKSVCDVAPRYLCTLEYQARGAIHFHALIWGIRPTIIESERSARMVARLWGHGFVDVIKTDGSVKLATYLAKYMAKVFADPDWLEERHT